MILRVNAMSVQSQSKLRMCFAQGVTDFKRSELALLRDLLLRHLLCRTGHRYRVRLAVETGYGLGKRPRKLVIAFSGSPAEYRATALDAVVRAGSARSRRAQERRGDGGARRSGKWAATAKLSVGGTLEMFALGGVSG